MRHGCYNGIFLRDRNNNKSKQQRIRTKNYRNPNSKLILHQFTASRQLGQKRKNIPTNRQYTIYLHNYKETVFIHVISPSINFLHFQDISLSQLGIRKLLSYMGSGLPITLVIINLWFQNTPHQYARIKTKRTCDKVTSKTPSIQGGMSRQFEFLQFRNSTHRVCTLSIFASNPCDYMIEK